MVLHGRPVSTGEVRGWRCPHVETSLWRVPAADFKAKARFSGFSSEISCVYKWRSRKQNGNLQVAPVTTLWALREPSSGAHPALETSQSPLEPRSPFAHHRSVNAALQGSACASPYFRFLLKSQRWELYFCRPMIKHSSKHKGELAETCFPLVLLVQV